MRRNPLGDNVECERLRNLRNSLNFQIGRLHRDQERLNAQIRSIEIRIADKKADLRALGLSEERRTTCGSGPDQSAAFIHSQPFSQSPMRVKADRASPGHRSAAGLEGPALTRFGLIAGDPGMV